MVGRNDIVFSGYKSHRTTENKKKGQVGTTKKNQSKTEGRNPAKQRERKYTEKKTEKTQTKKPRKTNINVTVSSNSPLQIGKRKNPSSKP